MGYGSNCQSGSRSRNSVFMDSLINHDLAIVMGYLDNDIHANAYRCKIIDCQSGNRSRHLEVVMGSLIDGGD